MNSREYAREFFKKLELTYDDIGMNELYVLIQMLNKNIYQTHSCMVMIKEPKLNGRYRNISINPNSGKIRFAELRVKGNYFEDREAITFNQDGFIGFCGWADGYNTVPFVDGFIEWCNWLSEVKKNGKI